MNVFYSTSSITSYIVQLYIKTDCFENLTFTPSKYTGIEYPRGEFISFSFSLSLFYEAWKYRFLSAFPLLMQELLAL